MAKRATVAEKVYPVGTTGDATTAATIKLREHLEQRINSGIAERMSFFIHWGEIASYIIPRRYKWLITPNQGNRGSPINQKIIDNTGTMALRTCANGMMGGITSPGKPWFKLTIDHPNLRESQPVKAWLDECTRRMLTVFAESNFYTSLATMYGDLASFGTAVLIIYEDFEDVIRCYNACAGEYVLANSDRMQVDTTGRQYVMTVRQVAQRFGLENCSETVKGAIQTGGAALDREIIICHLIEPNDGLCDSYPGMRGFKFRECYWEWGQAGSGLLRVRGFHENPAIAPRWDIVGNDAYGRSPGMDALGDVKQLQVQQKRKAQGIDKNVNPPMVADVALRNEPASMLPGGVTYVNTTAAGAGFRPAYEVKVPLGDMREDIVDVRGRINDAFFVDLFLMLAHLQGVQPRSEMELLERKEEKLVQLGPVLERFENEALDPAIERTFAIMLRAGLFPEIPEELQGQHINAEYTSILAQAQRAAMTIGLERLSTFVGRIAAGQAGVQGVGPEAMDLIDWDKVVDEYADLLGVAAEVVRPYVEVLKLREARASKQNQADAMATASAMVQGAEVLSKTQVGGGVNALAAMAA